MAASSPTSGLGPDPEEIMLICTPLGWVIDSAAKEGGGEVVARVMLPTIANESRKNKALELFGTKEYEVTTAIAQISKRFLIIGKQGAGSDV